MFGRDSRVIARTIELDVYDHLRGDSQLSRCNHQQQDLCDERDTPCKVPNVKVVFAVRPSVSDLLRTDTRNMPSRSRAG